MVHTWISLENNRLNHICQHTKVLKIFKNQNNYFYGDYNLDIFLSSKKEYKQDLETFVLKLVPNGERQEYQREYKNLYEVIENFGWISTSDIKKMFPRKENMTVYKTITICNNGNYMTLACETERFYYMFYLVTS